MVNKQVMFSRKTLLSLLITTVITTGIALAQNCPEYANTSSGTLQACGNQSYPMIVENTGCNGEIYFTVEGNYGTYGNEITWKVVSDLNGSIIASGGPGTNNGEINVTVGPIDPETQGNIFDLQLEDSGGDGFTGGGGIQIIQNGNVLAESSDGQWASAHTLFHANITISASTITIQTPSGPITSTVNNCKDFIVQVPLINDNYCTPISVELPWEITCDINGIILASGTQNLTLNPQVPEEASDIVSITWNTTECNWDVTPNNDCGELDIGTVFDISPNPNILPTDLCEAGQDQEFQISYYGATDEIHCCQTAGELAPIHYDTTLVTNDSQTINSPFGGTNNCAHFHIPPKSSGGNATSLDFCFEMTGYCFNSPNGDMTVYIQILVDGQEVFINSWPNTTAQTICLDLDDILGGYDQSSTIDIYVLPNLFSYSPFIFLPTIYTNHIQNGNCGSLASGEWTAQFDASLSVVFEEEIGSPVICDFPITVERPCCDSSPDMPFTVDGTNPTTCESADGSLTFHSLTPDTEFQLTYSFGGNIVDPIAITSSSDGEYTIENLEGGSYSNFTVQQGNCASCVWEFNDVVNLLGGGLPELDAGTNATLCEGESITLTAYNPEGMDIQWSNNVVDGESFQPPVGTNTYTVTAEVNGCEVFDGVTITVVQNPTYTVTTESTTCSSNDGEIEFDINGGGTEYSVSIDGGNTFQNEPLFTDLPGGNYSVVIHDENGCEVTGTVQIESDSDLEISNVTTTNTSCEDSCDGQIQVQITGGTAPFLHDWEGVNSGEIANNSNNLSDLCADTYTLSVTDANGCSVTETIIVQSDVLLEPSFTFEDFCDGAINGPINIQPSGGEFSVNNLNDGATINPITGELLNGVPGTTYLVSYSVMNGSCETKKSQEVTVYENPTVQFSGNDLFGCAPQNSTFTPTYFGDVQHCVWHFGDGTSSDDCGNSVSHTYTSAGDYSVAIIVTSQNGCSGEFMQTDYVHVDASVIADFNAQPMVGNTTNSNIDFINSSINADYYSWSFGDESAMSYEVNPSHTFPNTDEGSYIVTLIASNENSECSDTISMTIKIEGDIIFYIPNTFTPDEDSYNEVFKPIFTSGFDPQSYTLWIYNRWGEILFESNNTDVGWDGSYGIGNNFIVKEGTYIWKIRFKENYKDKFHEYMGHINVLK